MRFHNNSQKCEQNCSGIEKEWITRRQEQNPGRFSHWERASSAGLRIDTSELREFNRSEYMVCTSSAESAIAAEIDRD
jgi:hypothetical protein